MVYGLPALGETGWNTKLDASIEAVKATADAALPEATAETRHSEVTVVTGAGIDPTGVSDSTTAIQAKIDEAAAGSKVVHFPQGTYLHTAALVIPSNVHIRGEGPLSVLKAVSLTSGGAGVGHRQMDATSKTGFRISDLMLDASEMTVFSSGMRSILCQSSTNFSIERVHFRTPGAAVASIGCSEFTIDSPTAEVVASDGVAHHDGVIDQWGGCHDFRIVNPVIYGNNIAKYPILVTGEDTAGAAAACYNFTIAGAQVYGAKLVGIWVNGRGGVNHTFTIANPIVSGVTDFHGIAISDAYAWTLAAPVVRNVARNGIRVYTESAEGGVTGGDDGTILGPVVYNANTSAQAGGEDGSAIAILSGSNGVSLLGERVSGAGHVWAVYFDSTVTNCFHGGGTNQAGTSGKVSGDPNGGTYTPTLTGVANVTSLTSAGCRWVRDGDTITVSGQLTVTPTAAASTDTQVGISLPVASNFTSSANDATGIGSTRFGLQADITADTTNDRANLRFPSSSTAANVVTFLFTYRVL